MKDLKKLFIECKNELDKIGIKYGNISDISINTRSKKRWGQCIIVSNSKEWKNKVFLINISDRLLQDNISDNACKETILHEILHTCKNCFNHGKEWKELCNIVNYNYPYYKIKRTSTAEEKGIIVNKEIEYKYALKCKKCGRIIYRHRMSDFVKFPHLYKHSIDGGNFERIK